MLNHDTITPFDNSLEKKEKQVSKMFDSIAPKYDLLNRITSFRTDVYWRNYLLKRIPSKDHSKILDVATGTGDLAIALALKMKDSQITGIDISSEMLTYAKKKSKSLSHLNYEIQSAEHLNFSDKTFDIITVSFGIRNFENLLRGLKEIKRVLKETGSFHILEFGQPKNYFFAKIYTFYAERMIPFIGNLFSKNRNAYSYLIKSSKAFPCGEELKNILLEIGFKKVKYKKLTFGICYYYQVER